MAPPPTATNPGPGRPLKIHTIRITDVFLLPASLRPRVREDVDQVARYRDDMERGDTFPALKLFKGKAGDLAGVLLSAFGKVAHDIHPDDIVLILVDGYHRFFATLARDGHLEEIRATIESGSGREAQWAALGANHAHGLRLTNADKRRIITLVLDDKEWSRRSAKVIAEHAHVSSSFVDNVKKEHTAAATAHGGQSDSKVVVDKRGRVMETKHIGTTKTKAPPRDLAAAIQAAVEKGIPSSSTTPSGDHDTSDVYLRGLERLLDQASDKLSGASWNRFVTQARALLAELTSR